MDAQGRDGGEGNKPLVFGPTDLDRGFTAGNEVSDAASS